MRSYWTSQSFSDHLPQVCYILCNTPFLQLHKRKSLLIKYPDKVHKTYGLLFCSLQTRELHRFGGVSENDDLMIQRFVFKYIDLNEMEAKVGASEYRYLGEFFNDARLLLHNTFICYGGWLMARSAPCSGSQLECLET